VTQKSPTTVLNAVREPEGPLLEIFWGKGEEAKALYRECQEFLEATGQLSSPPDPPRTPVKTTRKPRQPNIRKLVKQAEKTGKTVTSITTPDGTRLDFGTPAGQGELQQDNNIEVDQWMAKHACAPERH